MKQKAKLRLLERVSVQDAPIVKPVKVRPYRHNSIEDSRREAAALLAVIRPKIALERIQADSKAINLALANGAKLNPGQVRTVLGPRGATEMLTPTREDYKRKRGQAGKGGAPLSLEALRAKEFSDKR